MNLRRKLYSVFLLGIASIVSNNCWAGHWKVIKTGHSFTVAINGDGQLYSWGKNNLGQLGLGDTFIRRTPTRVGNSVDWKDVALGESHVLATKSDGSLWVWGSNSTGQLGNGSAGSFISVPTQISGAWDKVFCGRNNSFAIRTDKSLWAWGDNSFGQLGDGTSSKRATPTKIGGGISWTYVATGYRHTMAIDNLGRPWTWGSNDSGQLGFSASTSSFSPRRLNFTGYAVKLAAGEHHSLLVSNNYKLYVWGRIGLYNYDVPTRIEPARYWTDVYSSGKTVFAIEDKSPPLALLPTYSPAIWTLGDNKYGQFGNGSLIGADTLTKLKDEPKLHSLSIGENHIVLTRHHGTQTCVSGNNSYGQLGLFKPDSSKDFECRNDSGGKFYFNATKGISDAVINLSWKVDITPAHRNHNPEVYFQIREANSKKEVYSEIIDSINNLTFLDGTTTLYKKPGTSIIYEIRILEYGPGNVLFDKVYARGITLPFIRPFIKSTSETPWSILVDIENKSDYNDKLYLYRDDSLIQVLDTFVNSFEDMVQSSSGSIKNGEMHEYKLMAVHTGEPDSIFANNTVVQRTYPIRFKATNGHLDTVRLSWNNLKVFVDRLTLKRDGETMAELGKEQTTFHDVTAIPGYSHVYNLELYLRDELKLSISDTGNILANGKIGGWVFNKGEDNITLSNVKLKAKANVNGNEVERMATTDANGYFQLKELPYYTRATYTITAESVSPGDSLSKTLSLRLEEHDKELNFELAPNLKQNTNLKHELDNFKVSVIDSLSKAVLSWETSGSDTIFYLVYRNEQIIHVGHQVGTNINSFEDLNGVPWETYEYKLKTFNREPLSPGEGYRYKFSQAKRDSAHYPLLKPVNKEKFKVIPMATDATVKLDWVYPQGNIDGFYIYRNDKRIAKLEPTERSFVDFEGENSKKHVYSIRSFRNVNDQVYKSHRIFSDSVKYPDLVPVSTVLVNSSPGKFATIAWEYPVVQDYNFDEFKVYRSYNGENIIVGVIRKSLPRVITDYDGVPGRTYQYYVRSCKRSVQSQSFGGLKANFIYPNLPRVQVLSSGNNFEGTVHFNTSMDSAYHYLDISVYDIAEDKELILYPGSKNHVIVPKSGVGLTSFSLTAVKTIEGKKYYGTDTVQVQVQTNESGPYDMDTITGLKASNIYASHVKLTWEYPNYFLPVFYIYRDGALLDSLEGVHKVYYDHQVPDGSWHLYQVQVRLNGKRSRRSGALGKTLGKTMINGMVYRRDNLSGIENAKVFIYANKNRFSVPKLLGIASSDASGYFELRSINLNHLDTKESQIGANVQHANARFENAYQTQMYYDSVIHYSFVFRDSLPSTYPESDTIANIKAITASSNYQQGSVELSWDIDNSNCSAFQIYRGLVLLKTIPASEPRIYMDKEGFPGYDYSYPHSSGMAEGCANQGAWRFSIRRSKIPGDFTGLGTQCRRN